MANVSLDVIIKAVWSGNNLDKGAAEVQKLTGATGQFGAAASLASVAGAAAFAAIGVSAVQFSQQSIEAFKSFESGMAEVFSLLPGITDTAMQEMVTDVQSFARENGKLTTEVVPALYQALSAGIPADNVFEFLDVANAAAVGGVTTMETAVDGLTSVVNAYGSDVLSVGEASDLMFRAVVDGKTTFEELSSSLYNVIPTAASLGLGFENITAALAAMTAAGTPTSVATTQMRQLLVELSKEGTKAAETFERVAGQSFRQFIANGGDLNQALSVMQSAADQSGVGLNDLFSSVEAGSAALSLSGSNAARFAEELERMGAAAGFTDAAAETMGQTLQRTFNDAASATEQLRLVLGEKLAPAIVPALEMATIAVDKLISALNSEQAQSFFDNFAGGMEYATGGFAARTQEMIDARARDADSMEEYIALVNDLQSISTELALVDVFDTDIKGDAFAQIRLGLSATTDDFYEYYDALEKLGEQSDFPVPNIGAAYKEFQRFREGQIAAAQATAESRLAAIEAKTATDDYAFALEEYQQALLGISNAEQQRQEFLSQSSTLTEYQIGQQEELTEQFARRTAVESGMYSGTEASVRAANLALERQIELEDQAAQAAEELAAQQREIAAASGDMFASVIESATSGTDPIGFFNESLNQLAESGAGVTANQQSVNQAIFDSANAAGASATELAILGGALGIYSEEAVDAALKTALIQAEIDRLTQLYLVGTLSVDEMKTSLSGFIAEIEAGVVAFPSGRVAIGEIGDTAMTAAGKIDEIAESAGVATTALLSIPSQVGVHVSYTSDPFPNVPGGTSQIPGGQPDIAFATGGWTGETGGIVHPNELVTPQSILAQGSQAVLDFAAKNVPGFKPSPTESSRSIVIQSGAITIYQYPGMSAESTASAIMDQIGRVR